MEEEIVGEKKGSSLFSDISFTLISIASLSPVIVYTASELDHHTTLVRHQNKTRVEFLFGKLARSSWVLFGKWQIPVIKGMTNPRRQDPKKEGRFAFYLPGQNKNYNIQTKEIIATK
jgi:hypothetical protein